MYIKKPKQQKKVAYNFKNELIDITQPRKPKFDYEKFFKHFGMIAFVLIMWLLVILIG